MSSSTPRSVLITGCTTGSIGDALAKEFQRHKLRVFATSRDIGTMESLRSANIETLPLDITDMNSIREARTVIQERTGGTLDILVNNAGIAYASAVSDMDMESVKKLFEVNLFGHMAMVHEFMPLLLASNSACIVQISSLAGLMPVPYNSAYNASKAALLSFGDTLRVELAPFGVKVINIAAGNVQSNIMKGSPTSLPSNSIYYPVNKEFVRDRIENFQKDATPADQFAKVVVSEALKSNPRAWVYTAKNTWTVWIISTFLGRRGFDKILSDMFGLSKLAKINQSQRRAGT